MTTPSRPTPVDPTAPVARATGVRGKFIRILCPLCDQQHEHDLPRAGRRGWEHRSPACGLTASPEQRAAGYRFDTREATP